MSTVNDDQAKKVLARNIRKRMDDRDWSIRDLSRETGDPVMSLHGAISGKSLPRAGMLHRIAEAFGEEVGALFADEKKSRIPA